MITKLEIEAAILEEQSVKKDYPNFYKLWSMVKELQLELTSSGLRDAHGRQHKHDK